MTYDLPTTTLGRTGLTVTRLGIGGAYCKTPEGYAAALDCGVNYLDTAPAYRDGEDEKVVGQAIVGRRDGIILATKTEPRDSDGARRDLETSLELLGTDHVDIWHIHAVQTHEEREKVLAPGGAMEAALKAREEGLVRFIGITGHVWGVLQKALATGLFDTVLCWYNCAMKEPEVALFPEAMAQGTGVVIMNATRNDRLLGSDCAPGDDGAPDPADFYRYVLSHEAVHLTLRGLRDIDTFRRIAAALAERDTLSSDERLPLEAYGARMRAEGKLNIE